MSLWLLKFLEISIAYAAPTVATAGAPAATASFAPHSFEIIIRNIYDLALLVGGLLAFGAIVLGGIRYTVSMGNSSIQSDARDQITQALIGLLLLLGIFLILHTIDPNLVNLNLPNLITPVIPTSTAPVGPGTVSCPTCASISGNHLSCKEGINCNADPRVVAQLQCIAQSTGINMRITEGYPPTGQHQSAAHNNGCAVDLTVSGGCGQVQSVVAQARACGAVQALNEYPSCGGTTYANTTGANIHVTGCR